jgi:DNA-binding NarL/FixJ family response regulator
VTVAAFVPDLMDRSRLGALVDEYVSSVDALRDVAADVVVVDIGRPGAPEAVAHLVTRGVRVVAFASHVDTATIDAARAAGAEVLPRSRFFADPAAALGQR